MTKIMTQTKIRKTVVDFMKTKIRSPTKRVTLITKKFRSD